MGNYFRRKDKCTDSRLSKQNTIVRPQNNVSNVRPPVQNVLLPSRSMPAIPPMMLPSSNMPSLQNGLLPSKSLPSLVIEPRIQRSASMKTYSSMEDIRQISNMTGWPMDRVVLLRREYNMYANPDGLIDRNGFLKLYIAGLIDKPWHLIEFDATVAFQKFDTNQTGSVDFNEYVLGCLRLRRNNLSRVPADDID